MAFSNLRRRRLFKPRRHTKEPTLSGARHAEDEVLTGWIETGSFAVSDDCNSNVCWSDEPSTKPRARASIDYEKCAVSVDRPGWVVTYVPRDKEIIRHERCQPIQPPTRNQEAALDQTPPAFDEEPKDEMRRIPGAFPVEDDHRSHSKRYKSWNWRDNAIYLDPYGRYPAQIKQILK